MCALHISAMAASSLASQAFLRRGIRAFTSYHSIDIAKKLTQFRTFPLTAPLSSSALGICHSPHAVKGIDVSLKGVRDMETVEEIKRIVEMADRALLRREVLHTDFLTPPVLSESMSVLVKLNEIKAVAQGGYPEAERCRLSVGHPDILTSEPNNVVALSISGKFEFEPCSHGDFLGAILNTGIVRDKLGDIILQGEKGAQVLVVPEIADFLISSLSKVRYVSVTCEKIPLLDIEYVPPSTKTLKTVEASLRFDAIASAGFKISRSKMAGYISDGDVRLNWTTVTKSNTTLKTGDVISVSGKGRLKVSHLFSDLLNAILLLGDQPRHCFFEILG
ncbi:RNA-binding isoform X1 [Olea europaea subsp. europaea]|uniref:RNA-binding isoform X1 n=1 Tax=Olea europaea subsp. europaea TaxID=158383 RepID=A0A8S0UWW0_OLEEU|nr:RNA-binding isoform X1 [Olea europaea subsp. europaea]